MSRRSSGGLAIRVVYVVSAGAADARRRVADVLLRAARAGAESPEVAPPPTSANEAQAPPGEKAA